MQTLIGSLALCGLLTALSFVAGCESAARNQVLRLGSSRLMVHVTRAWVDALKAKSSPLLIELSDSGSTLAIQSLIKGELDAATSSRRMRTDELMDARSRGFKIEESPIGFLIYTVVVHPSNPITSLTTQQVSDVFSGQIKSWDEVGGVKKPIVRVYRRVKPGEYDHFFERVVHADQKEIPSGSEKVTVVLDKPWEIVQRVAADPEAVGYLLTADLGPGLKTLMMKRTPSGAVSQPTVDAALDRSYPLLRPLYLYVNRASRQPVTYFREFVLGDEGREIARSKGMVPLPKKRGDVDANKLYEMLSW